VCWSTEVVRCNIPAILLVGIYNSNCDMWLIFRCDYEGINLHSYEGINLPILCVCETLETLTFELVSGKFQYIICELVIAKICVLLFGCFISVRIFNSLVCNYFRVCFVITFISPLSACLAFGCCFSVGRLWGSGGVKAKDIVILASSLFYFE
jgi:hypothetical protein